MNLIVKTRQYSAGGKSYHFYVEQDGVEIADLFVIPGRIHWNDQLRQDIRASIRDALKDVFSAEDIQDLQEQAFLVLQSIH